MSNKNIDTELNLFPSRQKMFFAALNTGFGKKKSSVGSWLQGVEHTANANPSDTVKKNNKTTAQ